MDTLAFLGDFAPGFAVKGCQVKVLTEPSDFFQELCQRSEKAQDRIAMAALYLGTGEENNGYIQTFNKFQQPTAYVGTNKDMDGILVLNDRYGELGWSRSAKQ